MKKYFFLLFLALAFMGCAAQPSPKASTKILAIAPKTVATQPVPNNPHVNKMLTENLGKPLNDNERAQVHCYIDSVVTAYKNKKRP